MSRLNNTFQQLKNDQRQALVGYIVSGDSRLSTTVPALHGLVEAGADVIELGMPFSDPMADGPAIQAAQERALAAKSTLRSTLENVRTFRETNATTPVVLMGYDNPVERMGYREFAQQASAAGVDGVIIVDLPPEEAVEAKVIFGEYGIDMIFLIAPTTTPARAKKIVDLASGFLYYVSLKGVTGAGHLDVEAVTNKLSQLREITDLPICVGFGIKTPESAAAVSQVAEGVVVGSLLVNTIGDNVDNSDEEIVTALKNALQPLRAAMDA